MITLAVALASVTVGLITLALRQLAPVVPHEPWPLRFTASPSDRAGRINSDARVLDEFIDARLAHGAAAPRAVALAEHETEMETWPGPRVPVRALALAEFDMEPLASPRGLARAAVEAPDPMPPYAQVVFVELTDENPRLLGMLRALAAEPTEQPSPETYARNAWRYRARSALWYAERRQWVSARRAFGQE